MQIRHPGFESRRRLSPKVPTEQGLRIFSRAQIWLRVNARGAALDGDEDRPTVTRVGYERRLPHSAKERDRNAAANRAARDNAPNNQEYQRDRVRKKVPVAGNGL